VSESEGILNRPFKVKERMRLGFVLFIVLAVVILAADITFFTVSIDKPYMGIVLSFSSKGWTVEGIDPNGNAYQQGIRAGDIPVEVNNQTATVFLQKYTGAGAVYGPIIKQLSVVDRSGQMKTAVLNNSLPSFNAVAELSMWLVTCLIFWIIGFSVFFKKQDNQAAKLLCLVGLFFGLNLSANLAAERVIPLAVQVGAYAGC